MPLANSPKGCSPRVYRPGQPHHAPAQDGPPVLPWARGLDDTGRSNIHQVPPLSRREHAIFPALLCLPPELPGKPGFLGFPGRWVTLLEQPSDTALEQEADPGGRCWLSTGERTQQPPCQRRRTQPSASHPAPCPAGKGTLQRLPFRRAWRGEAPHLSSGCLDRVPQVQSLDRHSTQLWRPGGPRSSGGGGKV